VALNSHTLQVTVHKQVELFAFDVGVALEEQSGCSLLASLQISRHE
jgi:hypothetical protein